MGKANKVTDLVLMIYNITEDDGVKVLGYPIIMYKIERDGFYFSVEKTYK